MFLSYKSTETISIHPKKSKGIQRNRNIGIIIGLSFYLRYSYTN